MSSSRAWLLSERNWQAAGTWNLIALDIDGDLTLEAFRALPFAQRHCLFYYTTPSHRAPQDDGTSGPDRFRAVFHTGNQRLDGVHLHRPLYRLVTERLGLELTDDCGEKPERLWFGNDRAEKGAGTNRAARALCTLHSSPANGRQG